MDIMPDLARQSFLEWSQLGGARHDEPLTALVTDILSALGNVGKTADAEYAPKLVGQRFQAVFPSEDEGTTSQLKFALAARLALKTSALLDTARLPASVLSYYPHYMQRAADDMQEHYLAQEFEPHKVYAALLTVQTVPSGAQLTDLKSAIPVSSAGIAVARMRSPMPLLRYLAVRGGGVWFRCHTDSRYLDEFNEGGFDQYYLRVADLLRTRSHVRGLVGTSWFYDPVLASISPRLRYLQEAPLSRGAFLMKHKTNEFDVEMATKTSPTRRKLFQEGKYRPVSYSLIWPREALLAWAARNTSTE